MNDELMIQMAVEEQNAERSSRIKMYKSILNYLKGRSFSLDVLFGSQQYRTSIHPQMGTPEELESSYKMVYNETALFLSLKDYLKLTHNTLTKIKILSTNDNRLKSEILNKIEGIIYFSKSLMKLYNEKYNELALIEKMKKYSLDFSDYGVVLKQLKEKQVDESGEKASAAEKAERLLYKINLIRAMKRILIGYITVNRHEIYCEVKNFQSSLRRNLKIEDFVDTWDVGLSSEK